MKLPQHILAAVLAAVIATGLTHGLLSRGGRMAAPSDGVVAARAVPVVPLPQTEVASAGLDAEELARLRKENAELKAQLAEARTTLVEHDSSLKLAKAELDELRRPMEVDLLSSTLRAELKSGEVVVTGGYQLADGRRLYAFAKPTLGEVDGRAVVRIEGNYLTVNDEAGRSVGLDNLATNAANTLQHGEVWVPEEAQEVFGKLQGIAGTDLVSYPTVSVPPGQSGVISVGGTQLKVTPTLMEGGDGLRMELRLEQAQGSAAEETAQEEAGAGG